MTVTFSNTFHKSIHKLKSPGLVNELKDVILTLENSVELQSVPNVKKLKGAKTAYRIRIGDYRVGFYYEEGVILLQIFAHRKDIYKVFP